MFADVERIHGAAMAPHAARRIVAGLRAAGHHAYTSTAGDIPFGGTILDAPCYVVTRELCLIDDTEQQDTTR